ncbi:UNVERIFIED_CONTAM: Transcription factor IIIA [Sesamum angustifolium]|uniref:Transcription factor IIIA n=1 Tax=Sesamum angustifolium TaxID=2727405 RepID=A0AAW2PW01_9LAMI
MEIEVEKARGAVFRDIRRYYCEYCGICRSKKSLISSHILGHHQEEMNVNEVNKEKSEGDKLSTCEVCGASFRKPAHLKQHMQSHSLERPFTCPVDDCHSSYRRKDHLTRHMIQHQGKLFECPIEECKKRFAFQGNMKRHIKELHQESSSTNVEPPKEYVCPELGCGKLSWIQRRPSVQNQESNLNQHTKAVHLGLKPYACSIPGCHMKFAFKHVRDKHEKSGCHVYTPGNFEESDEQFRSRPRGGRRRKCPAIETLLRKRVVPPSNSDLSKLLSADSDD